jgi:Pyruvate phosphate dikinase, AMP/ATP-binding domain
MTRFQRGEPDQLTGECLILPLQEFGERKAIYAAGKVSDEQVKSQLVLQVPASFVLTAAAYQEFMRKNRLHEVIEGLLEGVNVREPFQVASLRRLDHR